MCGTTWLEHSKCHHSERIVREDSKCAIGYAAPDSKFHWKEPQGVIHADDLCSTCQARLDKYGTADPSVSWEQLYDTVDKAKSTHSRKFTISATSTEGTLYDGEGASFTSQWE